MRVAILEKSNIPLPDHFLMDWLQKKNGAASRDQIEMYYQQYAKELRWALLVAAIDQKYHLQVTHEEVVREVRDQLEGTAESNEVVRQLSEEHMEQLIQKFLRENSEKNYRQVYEKVHAQKCINFMKDQITVLVREISVEQFDQPASEQLFF